MRYSIVYSESRRKRCHQVYLLAAILGLSWSAIALAASGTAPAPFSIAACTTWHPVLKALQKQGVEVHFTTRTRDSLLLLQANQVDLVIGGRLPFPDEPIFPHEIMGQGFTFLAPRSRVLRTDELHRFQFVTDQSPQDIVERFVGIHRDNVRVVDDVCDHLSQGIAITSLPQTDSTHVW